MCNCWCKWHKLWFFIWIYTMPNRRFNLPFSKWIYSFICEKIEKEKRRKIVYSAFHTIRLISIFGSYYDIYEMTKFPFLGKPREAHKTLKWIFASTDIEKVGESKKCTTMTSAETSKIPFDILYVFFAH